MPSSMPTTSHKRANLFAYSILGAGRQPDMLHQPSCIVSGHWAAGPRGRRRAPRRRSMWRSTTWPRRASSSWSRPGTTAASDRSAWACELTSARSAKPAQACIPGPVKALPSFRRRGCVAILWREEVTQAQPGPLRLRRYAVSEPAVAPGVIAVASCEDSTVAVHDAILNPGNVLVRWSSPQPKPIPALNPFRQFDSTQRLACSQVVLTWRISIWSCAQL